MTADNQTEEQEPVDATTNQNAELDLLKMRIEQADAERIRLEAEVKRQRMLVAVSRIDGLIADGQVRPEFRQNLIDQCAVDPDAGEATIEVLKESVIPQGSKTQGLAFGNPPVLQQ